LGVLRLNRKPRSRHHVTTGGNDGEPTWWIRYLLRAIESYVISG
jgi:hypothetical protein